MFVIAIGAFLVPKSLQLIQMTFIMPHKNKAYMELCNVIIKDSRYGYCKANLSIELGYIKNIVIIDTDPKSFYNAEFYVSPGFVNSHLHPNQLLDRRILDGQNISELLHNMHGNYKKNDEERYAQALLVLIEAIKSGATSIYSVASNPYPVIRAFNTLDLKGAITCFYNDRWEGFGTPPALSILNAIENQFTKAYAEKTTKVDIHIGSASVESASNELLFLIDDLAKRFKTKVNLHISEGIESVKSCTKSRLTSPVRLLSQLGILASHWNLIHAVNIDEDEIAMIANAGACVIHCPVSNAKTGVGVAPIKKFMEYGITLGLGSDACSNNNTNNILNEAYFAVLLQAAFHTDAKVVSIETLMKWMTENGYQILGTKQKGKIEIGESADLLLWSLHESAFVPLAYGKYDSTLIYNAPDIKPHSILMDGKIIVEDYQFKTISEKEVRETANQCGMKLFSFLKRL